jgi:hypothetical protein
LRDFIRARSAFCKTRLQRNIFARAGAQNIARKLWNHFQSTRARRENSKFATVSMRILQLLPVAPRDRHGDARLSPSSLPEISIAATRHWKFRLQWAPNGFGCNGMGENSRPVHATKGRIARFAALRTRTHEGVNAITVLLNDYCLVTTNARKPGALKSRSGNSPPEYRH